MVAFIQAVEGFARPWADLYNDHTAVSTAVTFTHLAGMLVAGGFAVATDRAVIRAGRAPAERRAAVLHELGAIHRPVVIGLAVVVLTGAAMLLSDVATFLPSGVFWAKMGLVGLLLGNGVLMQRAERRLRADPGDRRGWRSLTTASVRSGALWMLALLFGVLLTAAS